MSDSGSGNKQLVALTLGAAGVVTAACSLLFMRHRDRQRQRTSRENQGKPKGPSVLSAQLLSTPTASQGNGDDREGSCSSPGAESGRESPAAKEALQVAGHGGILYSPSKFHLPGEEAESTTTTASRSETAVLRKPTKTQEGVVYEDIFGKDVVTTEDGEEMRNPLLFIRPWVPKFYGCLTTSRPATPSVSNPGTPTASKSPGAMPATPTSPNGTQFWVEIENLCDGYEKPCVIDIKLGSRRFTPLTRPEEVAKIERKEGPTSARVVNSFRIAGLHQWRQVLGKNGVYTGKQGPLFPLTATADFENDFMGEDEEGGGEGSFSSGPPGSGRFHSGSMGMMSRTHTYTEETPHATNGGGGGGGGGITSNSMQSVTSNHSTASMTSVGSGLPADFLEVKSYQLRISSHKEVYRQMDTPALLKEVTEFCTVQQLQTSSLAVMSLQAATVADPVIVDAFQSQISQIIETLEKHDICDYYSFTACSLLLVYDAGEHLNGNKGRDRVPTVKARLIDFGKSGKRDAAKFFPETKVGFLQGLKNIAGMVDQLREDDD